MVRRIPLSEMPAWPRYLSRDEAAAYVGVSVGKFDAEVQTGIWPAPMRRGSRVTWDRFALDRMADAHSGLGPDDDDSISARLNAWQP